MPKVTDQIKVLALPCVLVPALINLCAALDKLASMRLKSFTCKMGIRLTIS